MDYNGKDVVLMACSSCNIKKCKHCYISYKGNRTSEELYNITKSLKNEGYNVYINGAEVLTNYEYLKSFKECQQDWLLTNGFAIYNDDSVLPLLKKNGINIIEMSYHFGIQDEISIMNKLRLNKVIEKIKSNGFKLKLLVTINSENYMNILDMCQKAINLGAYGIEFTLFLKQGNAINMNLQNRLNKEQQNHFFSTVKISKADIY